MRGAHRAVKATPPGNIVNNENIFFRYTRGPVNGPEADSLLIYISGAAERSGVREISSPEQPMRVFDERVKQTDPQAPS